MEDLEWINSAGTWFNLLKPADILSCGPHEFTLVNVLLVGKFLLHFID